MRFAVIGAGGLGCYFGVKLAAAGHEVVFVARGNTLAALRRDGIRVVGLDDVHVPSVTATQDTSEVGPVDAVLLCVKTTHLTEILPTLPPLLGPNTAVLTTQNGVETPTVVAEIVGADRVIPCIVKVFTQIAQPGVIEHRGGPGSVSFAEPDGVDRPRTQALRDAFEGAGVPVDIPDDVRVALWEKAVYIAAVGGLGAMSDATIGTVRTRLRHELVAVFEEAASVGRAHGVPLSEDIATRLLAFTDAMPPDSTTSMQRDLADGHPSELDGQVGAIVRLGTQARVATPRYALMYDVLSCRFAE
ncbi:2-dehydropantoate 2-reductase [Austwickia sp. TVS 96-490-7B]|nr:2-dehydropantoate 2-reductase [Austwickia sp. TVS 96-490-7B]